MLSSERLRSRLVGLGVVVAGLGGWLVLLGRWSGLPDGFARSQSASADDLERLTVERLRELHEGTARDLGRFVPGYVGGGLVVLRAVFAARGACRRDRRLFLLAAGALLLGGSADVVETLLFRGSLARLLSGAGAAEIDGRAEVTRVVTGVKLGLLAAAGLLLVGAVLRRPRPTGR